ncbi:MAG: hypothetical protein K2L39_08395 [Muribaculaceae bacterium]|nr:hypothetical protein [Muribaculaceae bacterium]
MAIQLQTDAGKESCAKLRLFRITPQRYRKKRHSVTKTANYLGNLQKKCIFAHYLAAKKHPERCGAMPERDFTGRSGCD